MLFSIPSAPGLLLTTFASASITGLALLARGLRRGSSSDCWKNATTIRLGDIGGPFAGVFRPPSPRRRDGNLGGRGLCGAFDDEGDAGFNIKCEAHGIIIIVLVLVVW